MSTIECETSRRVCLLSDPFSQLSSKQKNKKEEEGSAHDRLYQVTTGGMTIITAVQTVGDITTVQAVGDTLTLWE